MYVGYPFLRSVNHFWNPGCQIQTMSSGKLPFSNGEFTLSESTTKTILDSPISSFGDVQVDTRTGLKAVNWSRENEVNVSRGNQRDSIPTPVDRRIPKTTPRTRQKSEFYGDAFAYRECLTSTMDRLSRRSTIVVEIKTNVIVSTIRSGISMLEVLQLSPRF